jgi:superfamily II DNA or RNA helicase
MPRIFDNIHQHLLPALQTTIQLTHRADICVGYFNLRGWKHLAEYVDKWSGGENENCRLLVGMQKSAQEILRSYYGSLQKEQEIDQPTVKKMKKQLAEDFKNQLATGIPSNEDEITLRKLAQQIREKKLVVKLFLRHPLHAKLYLMFREDPINPIIGYLGSSNLTFSGLQDQGELNVDVVEGDACDKLAQWFKDRWEDRWCIDVSEELVAVIDESWARSDLIPPYYIYLDMAYHLSQEARAGISEFKIPTIFGEKLFEFQRAAVKIAAHHINKRGGVLIGDVVGLGKTLMASAVARIFEDDQNLETLIICPKNLQEMWRDYKIRYGLRAEILPLSKVLNKLPNLPRFRLVIIDESHNLRNRDGKRHQAIRDYIERNESKVVMLTATPYNKTYLDLSNQLRLFIPEDTQLGIRPEALLNTITPAEFMATYQSNIRSLAAFEKSEFAEDWRQLMRLFMVRRTRSFIIQNYAIKDEENQRYYLPMADGQKTWFPNRIPRSVKFTVDCDDPNDQYARLYTDEVVDIINNLQLPRYGLGNYIKPGLGGKTSKEEDRIIENLSKAGIRLKGFCRTNLFKRLESSGQVFLESIQRHIIRNFIFLYAIDNNLSLPIGTQDAELLDARYNDEDVDQVDFLADFIDENDQGNGTSPDRDEVQLEELSGIKAMRDRAKQIYQLYQMEYRKRFQWLKADYFEPNLRKELQRDAETLSSILQMAGDWNPEKDEKLKVLFSLVLNKHANEKVIVFTQFADTVDYLQKQFVKKGVPAFEGVTGQSENPTLMAWKFSPESNQKRDQIKPENELRILVATDVLSEGQNLQDGYIVVNYDLPWAIIRLIQRAGRVDRIGQQAQDVYCYTFLPADGVEEIIRLRNRLLQRLKENKEVVGTDEAFFEDEHSRSELRELYNEKAGILDGDDDKEVDLASYAYQIWINAVKADPSLKTKIPNLPPVVFSTKQHAGDKESPNGVLVYARTGEGTDSLAWINEKGESISEDQLAILKMAECTADEKALVHRKDHHDLIKKGVEKIVEQERTTGGQLGLRTSARYKLYNRLDAYIQKNMGTIFVTDDLIKALDTIYHFPLKEGAKDTINRQMRTGIDDDSLATLTTVLWQEGRLCFIEEEPEYKEPQIICSMGLKEERE